MLETQKELSDINLKFENEKNDSMIKDQAINRLEKNLNQSEDRLTYVLNQLNTCQEEISNLTVQSNNKQYEIKVLDEQLIAAEKKQVKYPT